ncbi:BrnT family toxin [Zavarzinia compransoris]|uniref:BrnT family toxin n=1 Tax=Zavarzinia compransoris TaxID=1264899 RepID=A0A317E424_9PROT|nr:BrnT family toxin [Zavarzinia compransoris]PWR19805.1 hypothetical protein DKG75_15205 [Zavarzinia compransoris]TDP45090.1 hypothetical protein DES42_106312 [Zavarzinia compransoris]
MSTPRLTWDEAKRAKNLAKHGLDFADAAWVLESDFRLDITITRNGEERVQSIAYAFERLRVLTLVHIPGEEAARIISFRAASAEERRAYHDWLAQEDS